MKTVRLYREDVYMKTCNSAILEVSPCEGGAILELDRSVFFPTGGGQPCDLGFIDNFAVVDVTEKQDTVYHKILIPDTASAPKAGDTVSCSIDWDRRFDNMQRHCGEHLLSGAFYKEYGGVIRGFHMGDGYITIDVSLEKDPAYTEVTYEMAKHAELCANKEIWANLPVKIEYLKTKAETENFPLRKEVEIENDISIVGIGNAGEYADCVACCGTHPATTGEVGLLKVYKVMNHKGMYRVFFEAGHRALADYDMKHDTVMYLCNRYSTTPEALCEAMLAQEERIKVTKKELALVKQTLIKQRIEELLPKVQENKIVVREYRDLKSEDLLTIGRPLLDKISKLLLIKCPEESMILLFSNGKDINCGKLVKENAHIYSGKGGGANTNARAIFPNSNNLDVFAELLEKHLR